MFRFQGRNVIKFRHDPSGRRANGFSRTPITCGAATLVAYLSGGARAPHVGPPRAHAVARPSEPTDQLYIFQCVSCHGRVSVAESRKYLFFISVGCVGQSSSGEMDCRRAMSAIVVASLCVCLAVSRNVEGGRQRRSTAAANCANVTSIVKMLNISLETTDTSKGNNRLLASGPGIDWHALV